jgi:hypothetical protein
VGLVEYAAAVPAERCHAKWSLRSLARMRRGPALRGNAQVTPVINVPSASVPDPSGTCQVNRRPMPGP